MFLEKFRLDGKAALVTGGSRGLGLEAALALKEAVDDGRIREGDHVLLVSFGAGLTWAAAVLTWGGA